MARPVQLPAGARAARQLPGARLRPAVLAALRALRRRARLEPLHAARVRRRGRRRVRVAARARAAARCRACGRSRVRARAVSSRAEHRAPARPDLALPPAGAALRRAPAGRCSPPRRSPRSRSPGRSASRSARFRSSSPTRSSAAAGCGTHCPGRWARSSLRSSCSIRDPRLDSRRRAVAERGRPLLRGLGRVSSRGTGTARRSSSSAGSRRCSRSSASSCSCARAGTGSPRSSRPASSSPSWSRSGRTCRRTGSRATSSRTSRWRGCPSGCFRSRVSPSPRCSRSPSPPGQVTKCHKEGSGSP